MCITGSTRPTPAKLVLTATWALLGLACLARLQAADVTLAWDPNTEPDIAGYRLYYGTPIGTYSSVVNVGNHTNTTVVDLQTGLTYAFYVTCYNTSGLESEPSNVVQYTVPATGGGNHPPLALNQVITAAPGQEIDIVLQGQDLDGDPLSFNLDSFPSMGQITDYAVNSGTSATVTYQAPVDYLGQDVFTFSVDDGYESSPQATVTINLQSDDPGVGTDFLVGFEAESATLLAPMGMLSDETASSGGCIAASTSNDGAATLEFTVPAEGDYIVWCRVKTPSGANDSFIVTLDNDPSTADIYDASEGVFGDTWHWTALAGRGGINQPYTQANVLSPRVFHLTAGTHTLTFEGRERDTGLDALIITSDTTFDAAAASDSRISGRAVSTAGGFLLEWPAFPGLNYRVSYKSDMASASWTPFPEVVTATSTRASYLDTSATGAQRFYRLEILP